jgi:hypothetical protein
MKATLNFAQLKMIQIKNFKFLVLSFQLFGFLFAQNSYSLDISGIPKVILWAWERPENLDFINPCEIGIAFLAKTIYMGGDKAIVRPRFQPLKVPHGTKLIAVARIESDRRDPPELSSEQLLKIASELNKLAYINGVIAIQIDFDAVLSERDFYRQLILKLHDTLPDSTALTITALASWCIYDDWISDLPIDEAVPMLFRMSVDRKQIIAYLKAGNDFRPSMCKSSLGISLDEPIPFLSSGKRIYIFNPISWSKSAFEKILKEVKK